MFSIAQLKELAQDENSCIKVVEVGEFPIMIHPSRTKKIKKGIRNFLDEFKSYHNGLGGIPMGYDNVKVLPPGGWLLDTNPYLHMLISATFYVFAPEPGDIIKGTVTRIFSHHIGCLVHGIFNITSWRLDTQQISDWCGSNFEGGEIIKLKLNYVNLKSHVPYMVGDIEESSIPSHENKFDLKPQKILFNDDDSGISTSDPADPDQEVHSPDEEKKPIDELIKKKKNKKDKIKSNLDESDSHKDGYDSSLDSKSKIKTELIDRTEVSQEKSVEKDKRKKKRKRDLNDNLETNVNSSSERSPANSNKKEKKIKIKKEKMCSDDDDDRKYVPNSPLLSPSQIKKENSKHEIYVTKMKSP